MYLYDHRITVIKKPQPAEQNNQTVNYENRNKYYNDFHNINTSRNSYHQLFVSPHPGYCPSNLITVRHEGRLGNVMGEYASLWGLARKTERSPVIPNKMKKLLQRYFKRITIPSASTLPHCDLKWKKITAHFHTKKTSIRAIHGNIEINNYAFLLKIFNPFAKEIRREFHFKNKIISKAQRVINGVGECMYKNCTYISVHVRRTDYSKWLETHVSGHLVKTNYIYNAMLKMRGKFPEPVFLVVSDDMSWCRENLNFTDFHVKFVGNQDSKDPITDLALMALTNHSILTHGTFGFWGGYLSEGEVIQPVGFSKVLPYPQNYVMQAKLNGWTMLTDGG